MKLMTRFGVAKIRNVVTDMTIATPRWKLRTWGSNRDGTGKSHQQTHYYLRIWHVETSRVPLSILLVGPFR